MSKLKGIIGAYGMMALASEMIRNQDPPVYAIETREGMEKRESEKKVENLKEPMLAEYAKIQKKESNLSANKRKFVVWHCERYYHEETKQMKS